MSGFTSWFLKSTPSETECKRKIAAAPKMSVVDGKQVPAFNPGFSVGRCSKWREPTKIVSVFYLQSYF